MKDIDNIEIETEFIFYKPWTSIFTFGLGFGWKREDYMEDSYTLVKSLWIAIIFLCFEWNFRATMWPEGRRIKRK